MRIISKTTDYYDSIQSYGLDSSIVFVRNELEFTASEVQESILGGKVSKGPVSARVLKMLLAEDLPQRKRGFGRLHWEGLSDHLKFHIVGFCGYFYPCVEVISPNTGNTLSADRQKKNGLLFYKGDDTSIIHEFVQSWSRVLKPRDSDVEISRRKIKRFLGLEFKHNDDLFHQLKSPIIVFDVTDCYRGDKDRDILLTVNANLADYNFYRAKDPFTAFQDIGQFLSGVLGNLESPGSEISDQDMRDAKGFDEMSFKKRPSKHR